jgi:hypothetical protein
MNRLLIALLILPAAASAQTSRPVANQSNTVGRTTLATGQVGEEAVQVSPANPLPVTVAGGFSKQESFQLATNNVAANSVTAFGGSYIFSQVCTTYGSISLQVRGPDGNFQTMVTKTATETGGSSVLVGSGAVMRVTLSGTTGCNASLSRVPA